MNKIKNYTNCFIKKNKLSRFKHPVLSLLIFLSFSINALSNEIKEINRFYSTRYAIQIDLPENYKVNADNDKISFKSDFAQIEMFFFNHRNFIDVFNQAKTMGKGRIISSNQEVRYTHTRTLQATRGGYIIFLENEVITHLTVLRKEHRNYIFKSIVKEKDFPKLRQFISSIRLLIPEEISYEAENANILYRLTLLSDYSFRFSILKNGNAEILLGNFYNKGNLIHLNTLSKIKKIMTEEAIMMPHSKEIILTKDIETNSIIYNGIKFKRSIINY